MAVAQLVRAPACGAGGRGFNPLQPPHISETRNRSSSFWKLPRLFYMKQQLRAILELTRYREYLKFVLIISLLGVATANGIFGWRLIGVVVANWLIVAFAFMINDVEDAKDDAQNLTKAKRNPISAGRLSVSTGYTITFLVVFITVILLYFLGLRPLIVGVICLVISFLYSWRAIRLKSIPVIDLLSHGLMLAGLLLLVSFFAFEASISYRWIWPFLSVTLISFYGQLHNELRDLETDLKVGIKNTAVFLGKVKTQWLMMTFLFLGVVSGIVSLIILELIPLWVLILAAGLTLILIIKPLLQLRSNQSLAEKQESLRKPFEIATAIALTLQFLIPWG